MTIRTVSLARGGRMRVEEKMERDTGTVPGCRSSATPDWYECVCVRVCVCARASSVGIGYGCHDCQCY